MNFIWIRRGNIVFSELNSRIDNHVHHIRVVIFKGRFTQKTLTDIKNLVQNKT